MKMQKIVGDSSGNSFIVGDGSVRALLGGGDDNLIAGGGDNVVSGGSGDDTMYLAAHQEVGAYVDDNGFPHPYIYVGFDGPAGDNTAHGGSGDDFIESGRGNDHIYGDSGDDLILTGDGDNKAYGGSGHDLIIGGSGDDHLYGGSGDDTISGGSGADIISGGLGADRLYLSAGDHAFVDGDDTLVFTQDDRVGQLILSGATPQTHLDLSGLGAYDPKTGTEGVTFDDLSFDRHGFMHVQVEATGVDMTIRGTSFHTMAGLQDAVAHGSVILDTSFVGKG